MDMIIGMISDFIPVEELFDVSQLNDNMNTYINSLIDDIFPNHVINVNLKGTNLTNLFNGNASYSIFDLVQMNKQPIGTVIKTIIDKVLDNILEANFSVFYSIFNLSGDALSPTTVLSSPMISQYMDMMLSMLPFGEMQEMFSPFIAQIEELTDTQPEVAQLFNFMSYVLYNLSQNETISTSNVVPDSQSVELLESIYANLYLEYMSSCIQSTFYSYIQSTGVNYKQVEESIQQYISQNFDCSNLTGV